MYSNLSELLFHLLLFDPFVGNGYWLNFCSRVVDECKMASIVCGYISINAKGTYKQPILFLIITGIIT